mmetsp:Transcript_13285/g.23865  ORF Transcript_13285/g.23865 Transcript_13285/m.23865 type:complete len:203 (-) Transcript_13285:747-1355(-)
MRNHQYLDTVESMASDVCIFMAHQKHKLLFHAKRLSYISTTGMILYKHSKVITCDRKNNRVRTLVQQSHQTPKNLHIILFHSFHVIAPEHVIRMYVSPLKSSAEHFMVVNLERRHQLLLFVKTLTKRSHIVQNINICPTTYTQLFHCLANASPDHFPSKSWRKFVFREIVQCCNAYSNHLFGSHFAKEKTETAWNKCNIHSL